MLNFLRRVFLTLHFSFAFTVGLVPAWGQSIPGDANEPLPPSRQPTVDWNGESVAVICPPKFRKSLELWVNYRMSQGYQIYVLEEPKPRPETANDANSDTNSDANIVNRVPYTTPAFLKSRIRALVRKDPSVKYLLLIGDAVPDVTSEATASDRLIPTGRVEALVISEFGKEKDIATDNYYADLSDDNMPELAVGRLPVDSPEELDVIIAKIIRYESESLPGFWQRRINMIAGVGGFSPLIDSQIESSVRFMLSEMIDEGYDLSMTQANWKSAFCPPPELFRSVTVERLNEGCLFWVYMGHGHHASLDYVRTPLAEYAIFVEGDSQYVHSRSGLPIAIFCACYTGAFDAIEDCIAEDLIRRPQGPVAVIASSRVAMPYGMAVFGLELIDEVLGENSPANANPQKPLNIGTVFLKAKRNLLTSPPKNRRVASTIKNSADVVLSVPAHAVNTVGTHLNGSASRSEKRGIFSKKYQNSSDAKRAIRSMMDTLAWLSDPTSSRLNEQLIDHAHLFHLFGDPLLRLPLPGHLTFDIPESVEAGNTITVKGNTDSDCHVVVELATPLGRPISVPKDRTPFKQTDEANEEFMKTYLAANNRTLHYAIQHTKDGIFSFELPVPDDLDGEYIVRAFSSNTNGIAVGSAPIIVKPKTVAVQGKRFR